MELRRISDVRSKGARESEEGVPESREESPGSKEGGFAKPDGDGGENTRAREVGSVFPPVCPKRLLVEVSSGLMYGDEPRRGRRLAGEKGLGEVGGGRGRCRPDEAPALLKRGDVEDIIGDESVCLIEETISGDEIEELTTDES